MGIESFDARTPPPLILMFFPVVSLSPVFETILLYLRLHTV